MVVGEMPEGVDMLVIGGGPGGYVAALAAARHGRKVVLVDADGEDGLGGVCVRVGCIPSKALIELAGHVHGRTAWTVRGAPATSESVVDLASFQHWKEEVVAALNGGVRGLLQRAGVDVRRGWFRFTRTDQGALVTDPDTPPQHLQFASCILATGSRPIELAALPFDGSRIVSSTDVLALEQLPSRVAVVGGGYVGLELGTALAKLGSHLTIIEAGGSLLPAIQPAATAVVAKELERLGITALTNATAIRDDGRILTVANGDQTLELEVDMVAVCVGRHPNTDDLGLDALGVSVGDDGRFDVGPDLLVTPRVAAIGDVTPGPALAHKASAEGHVAAAVLSGHRARFDPAAIPAVVFSDPEIAQTGLDLQEAATRGHDAHAARFPLTASGRARTIGDQAGFAEYVYDLASGVVLGATIVGAHASELIAQATLAIEMAAHLEDVAGTIHAHPTMSEAHHETALLALGRPVHITGSRR